MNKKVFVSLGKKTQGIVVKSAQEAAVYERKWNADQMGKQIKVLKEKGMQIAEPDLKPFQAAMKPIYDKYGPKFGSLLKEIQAVKK